MANAFVKLTIFILSSFLVQSVFAADLKVGDPAPVFILKTHEGKDFDLNSRKGQWTVLYFYPKAGTSGCTVQADGFRDKISALRSQGADVYGISTDTVKAQSDFHKTEKLNFTLLADADAKVVGLYGTKMPMLSLSKRWTYILDPELKIRWIQKDVDPIADAQKTAEKIPELKAVK